MGQTKPAPQIEIMLARSTPAVLSEQVPAALPQQQPAPALSSETGAILAMIERAASDPRVDIEKMERLFAQHSGRKISRARTANTEMGEGSGGGHADLWAAALAETATRVKAVEDAGGTVSGIDINFPPGAEGPQMDLAIRLPQPLDRITLQSARELLAGFQ